MKQLLLLISLLIITSWATAQSKLYHGLGASVGFTLEDDAGQKVFIHPEYELNILNQGEKYIHGFVLGLGVGISTASVKDIFPTAKAGYKLDAFAAGLIMHFMKNETVPGIWVNANVSDRVKLQVSAGKYAYITAGALFFPAFMNRRK